jgi:polysaccharide export outer membrane protein
MAVAVLLIQNMEAAIAQLGAQQMSSSSSGASASPTMGGHGPSVTTAASGNSGLSLVPQDFTKLKLAPGFLLSLNVLDDPDFVGAFRVDQRGDIALPILGSMHVAGESVPAVRARIQKSLSDNQILNDPQVNLTVLEYTAPEITIIGEVASPGQYPLLVSRTLVEVLALAGGTTLTAGNEVQITRGSAGADPVLVDYSRATNPKFVADAIVNPGDTVQVKRAGIVYVLGAVTRPGGYVMQEEGTLTVLQAISLANGTTLPASTGSVVLLRRNADGTEVDIVLRLDKISHGKTPDVQLHATDVLYVPTSRIKSAFINGGSIMASTASAAIISTAVY